MFVSIFHVGRPNCFLYVYLYYFLTLVLCQTIGHKMSGRWYRILYYRDFEFTGISLALKPRHPARSPVVLYTRFIPFIPTASLSPSSTPETVVVRYTCSVKHRIITCVRTRVVGSNVFKAFISNTLTFSHHLYYYCLIENYKRYFWNFPRL